MNKIEYDKIEDNVLESIPEFKERYLKITGEYGYDLKHIIIGDFSEFFIESFEKCDMVIVFKTIMLMERLLEFGDNKVKDLIITSFLENLHNSGKSYEAIKEILLPISRKYIEDIDFWYQGSKKSIARYIK